MWRVFCSSIVRLVVSVSQQCRCHCFYRGDDRFRPSQSVRILDNCVMFLNNQVDLLVPIITDSSDTGPLTSTPPSSIRRALKAMRGRIAPSVRNPRKGLPCFATARHGTSPSDWRTFGVRTRPRVALSVPVRNRITPQLGRVQPERSRPWKGISWRHPYFRDVHRTHGPDAALNQKYFPPDYKCRQCFQWNHLDSIGA